MFTHSLFSYFYSWFILLHCCTFLPFTFLLFILSLFASYPEIVSYQGSIFCLELRFFVHRYSGNIVFNTVGCARKCLLIWKGTLHGFGQCSIVSMKKEKGSSGIGNLSWWVILLPRYTKYDQHLRRFSFKLLAGSTTNECPFKVWRIQRSRWLILPWWDVSDCGVVGTDHVRGRFDLTVDAA